MSKYNFGILGVALVVSAFLTPVFSFGQEESAAAPAPAAEVSAQSAETPSAPTPAGDFLALEKSARAKTPDIFAKLEIVKKFTRRLPNFWGSLKLTKKQKDSVYAIQEEYFKEIASLTARIERLEKERDAKMRAVLSDKQRQKLDADVAAAEKKRADKALEREAAEEAELEAELEAEE
ncbi:MAG: hypothetical protein HUK22_05730 [Thermoguttaceae bacterium]|nr:hypothetical protein [Thermoguttaceae bacterium]